MKLTAAVGVAIILGLFLLIATPSWTDGKSVRIHRKHCNKAPCFCTMEYNPVCGSNGRTYGNACGLRCDQPCVPELSVAHTGECSSRRRGRGKHQRERERERQENLTAPSS